ncbi:rho family gtpase [Holotrichia oblita]|uniref:Rho family gtpase n=1 Tax=Holotrichia oblita TaxID=644536 RepID=A0ACB9T0B7_HOLOL|nr:rho family gtpase [Holotrichia oblita]
MDVSYSADLEEAMSKKKAKITVIGDGCTGKAYLLEAYIRGEFYERGYIPTIFENYTKEKDIDGESYSLSLSTMGGQEDYDSLRPLSYPNTTCFLLCFSINKRESFTNIESKWVVEIKEYMPGTPFILVGTKNDLREVDDATLKLISVKEGKKLAREIGAERYLECSAKNITTFDDVVVEAVRAGLKKRKEDIKQDHNCVLG